MKVDPRFLKEEGTEVFLGNELLVKGLLETGGGTHLWTGYPGSPISGFFDCVEAIQEIPKQYGISAVLANNEALSAAMVNGSQMHGLRAMCVMKSVGLHVATDALALGNLAGAHPEGGVIVVMGDDPWSDSTQVPADSRYLCKHIFMPVLEPATNQEMKDWVDLAFRLSRESELYIGFLVTTNQADGGGSVQVARNHFPRVNTHNPFELDTAKVDFEKNVLLPPRTWRREQDFPSRYRRLWASARRLGVNRISPGRAGIPGRGGGTAPLGFISSALAYSYLEHALAQLGLAGTFPLLKLGITYPLDPELIDSFAGQVENIVVVEERRDFLEEQVVQLLARRALTGKATVPVYGKIFPGGRPGLPSTRGFNSSILVELLAPLITELAAPKLTLDPSIIKRELALLAENRAIDVQLAPRTPTFCPGCPHRDSASVLGEIKRAFRDTDYMRRTHRREPVDLVFHGDTGCYTMLMFEPNKDLMHNYSGMGLGGATGLGIDPFITNKQVVFMGDSTFFHSGQIAISNSIKNGQDITYVILDNKTTAMTGQQTTPGLEYDLLGRETFVQKIEKIIGSMIENSKVEVLRVNPAQRATYRSLLESTVLKNGVKVVVADKECGITFHRRRNLEERAEVRQKGFVESKRHIQIVSDACEHCLECTRATGCPGLTFIETDFGRKVQTDLSWCVNDTACTKLDACPAFEEVTVIRSQKPLSHLPDLEKTGEIPLPVRRDFDPVWHGYLAGVGGMGIGVSTATLVRAGHREGYQVVFSDKNGLAIRNGGVYSHITFLKPDGPLVSPIIPYGKADLMLGIDILEAARGLDPKGNLRVGGRKTRVIVNRHKTPTINTLLGTDDFCVDTLEESLRRHTDASGYFSTDVSRLSEGAFGTKLYANVIMLGIAFQRGELPLSLASLEYGIQETMGSAATENWLAFKLGRKIAHDALTAPRTVTADNDAYHDIVAEKSARLRRSGPQGERLARQYWQLVTGAREKLTLDPRHESLLAQRIYNLIRYENLGYAGDYVARLLRVHARDSAEFNYAATQAALWNLHRVMAIKDEIYVAWLLSSEEKFERDLDRYNVRPELGDRLVHRHLNRPEFTLGKRTLRFKIKTRPWMLRLMRRAKFLRRLLPAWHARERAFRDWYFQIADQFEATEHRATYEAWLKILRLPEEATGFREIRYPKMERAQKQAAEILASLPPSGAAHKVESL
ncbi:MAG: 2-oxoacid:acceptor oxidoreductase family protein [Methylacidiphilales bacterium]|nr:2-oxoacid:acceptor oxidoreductase family protein [Candidatus Methylacidiphilales bacterium]